MHPILWLEDSDGVFADRLVLTRNNRGWSQEVLAEKARIRQEHLSRLERKKARPLLRTALRLAKALEVPISVLTGEYSLDTPVLPALASNGYKSQLLSGHVFDVTVTVPLDASNSMALSLGFLNAARLQKADRLLLHAHDSRLTPQQQYRNARSGIEWCYGQGYRPRIALVCDSGPDRFEAARFGMEIVADWGLPATCRLNVADAIQWLHSDAQR